MRFSVHSIEIPNLASDEHGSSVTITPAGTVSACKLDKVWRPFGKLRPFPPGWVDEEEWSRLLQESAMIGEMRAWARVHNLWRIAGYGWHCGWLVYAFAQCAHEDSQDGKCRGLYGDITPPARGHQ